MMTHDDMTHATRCTSEDARQSRGSIGQLQRNMLCAKLVPTQYGFHTNNDQLLALHLWPSWFQHIRENIHVYTHTKRTIHIGDILGKAVIILAWTISASMENISRCENQWHHFLCDLICDDPTGKWVAITRNSGGQTAQTFFKSIFLWCTWQKQFVDAKLRCKRAKHFFSNAHELWQMMTDELRWRDECIITLHHFVFKKYIIWIFFNNTRSSESMRWPKCTEDATKT